MWRNGEREIDKGGVSCPIIGSLVMFGVSERKFSELFLYAGVLK
jgi:hypothetical protein